jgi:hypothetical protein
VCETPTAKQPLTRHSNHRRPLRLPWEPFGLWGSFGIADGPATSSAAFTPDLSSDTSTLPMPCTVRDAYQSPDSSTPALRTAVRAHQVPPSQVLPNHGRCAFLVHSQTSFLVAFFMPDDLPSGTRHEQEVRRQSREPARPWTQAAASCPCAAS